jgi:CHAT domain-containing protein/tetratricopeptide (TPR) repeat protein
MHKILPLLYCSLFSIITAAQNVSTADDYKVLDSILMQNFKTKNLNQCLEVIKIAQKKAINPSGLKDSTEYATFLGYKGFISWYMGSYKVAKKSYLENLKLQEILYGKDHMEYMETLNNLAVLYHEMGLYDQAEPLYLKTNNYLVEKLGENNITFARSLNNLATLYQDMGDYQQAEPLLIQAKNIKQLSLKKAPIDYATSLNNLAYLYQDMKRYGEAERLFIETKTILQKSNIVDSERLLARTINNLASLYQDKKDYKKAEQNFQQALELKNKFYGEAHPSTVISINNLASLYQDMQLLDKAEALFLEAVQLRANIFGQEHPNYSESLNNLALVYQEQKKLSIALSYALQSIAANSPELDSSLTLKKLLQHPNLNSIKYYSNKQCLASLSTLLEITHTQALLDKSSVKYEAYNRLAQIAMQINQGIRHQLNAEKDKLRTIQKNTQFIEHGIQSALLLGEKKHIKEAFLFAELNKSVLLSDAINDNQAKSLGDLPDSLAIKERKLLKELDGLKKKQLELKPAHLKEENNNKIANLQLKIRDFIRSLKDKYPKYHALKYEDITASTEDIQALLSNNKHGDALLLEYFQTDEILYLFSVSKNSIQLFPIPISKKELNKKIKDLRYLLSSYHLINKKKEKAFEVYTKTAHWFYQNIIALALKGRSEKRLIIVTDGELGHLPFETFLVQAAPKEINYSTLKYLMNDYSISYNYSSTLWKENKAINNKNNQQMLACAADYQQNDSFAFQNRLPQVIRLRKQLQPLAAAQKEVKSLEQLFEGKFLFGQATNEKAFKQTASEYGIIHLAMHGALNTKHPILSSLAFTENQDSLEDNLLQAYEIAQLQLNADLVVLSACETGYGKFEEGEGIVSLARSFMYAGTPSLVVSLWSVNDFSTAVIMSSFYQNLKKSMPKDEALRQAKLNYIQNIKGPASHPAYWSPFIQIGDSETIGFLATNNYYINNTWEIITGIVFVFLLLIIFYLRKK